MRIPFFCSYIPVDILEAMGHEVIDISLFNGKTYGDDYNCSLHDNICSYANYLLRKILEGDKAFDWIIVPNACDAMKKLHISLSYSGKIPSFLIDLPRRMAPESAMFLAHQYKSLLDIIAPNLQEMDILARLHHKKPARMPAADMGFKGTWDLFSTVIGIAGATYTPSLYRAALDEYNSQALFLRHCGYGVVHGQKREQPKSLKLTEQLFFMAMDSLGHTLCPRSDRGAMADYIVAETNANGLSVLILTSLKFCNFYAFEFERIRRRLPPDFPILNIENDFSAENDGRNKTRIEAFMEQIHSRTGAGRTWSGQSSDRGKPGGKAS
ncbi:MAG: hypothetical protein CSYNP_02577 [Syntrophus sp. SKADARSKE-3]|nr:hypothetical protein [Syntrophus sp. SKADARSKE-3]